jgi:hypothetical protein
MEIIVIVFMVAAVYLIAQSVPSAKFCMTCKKETEVKNKTSGSFGSELIVWIIAIVLTAVHHWIWLILAIGYTLIRTVNKKQVCKECSGEHLVEATSQAAINEKQAQQENQTKPCPYCAEPIKLAAIVCKHCKSDLASTQQTN